MKRKIYVSESALNELGEDTVREIMLLSDERLSWKAKGIYYYIKNNLTKEPVSYNMLKEASADGISSIMSGIKELKQYGYLKIERIVSDGKFAGYEWILNDVNNE